jgi:hypothetical protein
MASFSVTDAAFEGIRVTRESPRTVAIWALFYLAFSLVLMAVARFTLGPHYAELLAAIKPSAGPAESMRLLKLVAPFFNVAGPLALIFMSMLTAAIFRRVLRPDEARIGLRLGRDELRLLVMYLIMTLALTALLFVLILIYVIAASIPENAASGAISALVELAALVGAAFVLLRLSLAGPATLAEGRLAFASSWRITHGQTIRLMAAYALAFVLGLVVLFLVTFLLSALLEAVHLATGLSLETGAPRGVAGAVAGFLLQVVWSLLMTGQYLILLAPPAVAYLALSRGAAPGSVVDIET